MRFGLATAVAASSFGLVLHVLLQAWFVPKMWAQDPYVVPKPFDTQAYTKGRGRCVTPHDPYQPNHL